ncbi:MAG: UbiX family flavin prenyltransferase [Candidatus Thermoplasmatota archaeon]|jgi:4-hydroxy-3-polyprenylbenzoate decarboxylase|nr:UbiX family flavin prenyltransferase [Candidatus Thermoplasmatota archaeon]
MTGSEASTVVVGFTGASGAPIAVAVLKALHAAHVPVQLIVSAGGELVLREECDLSIEDLRPYVDAVLGEKDFTARVASGSSPTRGMVIVPCSANTLAKVAHGFADNLIARAAHVHLKEHRPLILVPRETPLSVFTLRNMTLLTEAGALLLVASPPYYLRATKVEQLVDYLAGKVLDHLGVPHSLYRGWKSGETSK